MVHWVAKRNAVNLGLRDIHVWRVNLEPPRSCIEHLYTLLSDDERQRRFFFCRDHDQWIVNRGVLRILLGQYVNVQPGDLKFSYTAFGKPFLSDEQNREKMMFNVSHSRAIALIAVTRGKEIGIDVEYCRPNVQDIAENFSPQEVAALRSLPTECQEHAFFDCWSRKEAYVKARGNGLSMPLNQFSVSLGPDDPAELLHTDSSPLECRRWSLFDLQIPDYSAAVAVEGHGSSLQCYQWIQQVCCE